MGKRRRRRLRHLGLGGWIIIVICAIVFFGCLAYLGLYAQDKAAAQHDFVKLDKAKESGMEKMYEENSDFVGWLTLKGTKVNYPVVQTPEKPEYYIHRDFNKGYSESGTPFMDETSVISGTDKTWSWFIYGHNMKFGTMFHDLLKYDQNSFWEKHKTFTFTTYEPGQPGNGTTEDNETRGIEDKGIYEIFAAAYSQIRTKDSTKFKYYKYPGFTDENSFNEFVAGVKAESLYDTGIMPKYGEQIVLLSTCAYHTKEGRFYVAGVRRN